MLVLSLFFTVSTLHITNGDHAGDKLRSIVDGPVTLACDVLHEGPCSAGRRRRVARGARAVPRVRRRPASRPIKTGMLAARSRRSPGRANAARRDRAVVRARSVRSARVDPRWIFRPAKAGLIRTGRQPARLADLHRLVSRHRSLHRPRSADGGAAGDARRHRRHRHRGTLQARGRRVARVPLAGPVGAAANRRSARRRARCRSARGGRRCRSSASAAPVSRRVSVDRQRPLAHRGARAARAARRPDGRWRAVRRDAGARSAAVHGRQHVLRHPPAARRGPRAARRHRRRTGGIRCATRSRSRARGAKY